MNKQELREEGIQNQETGEVVMATNFGPKDLTKVELAIVPKDTLMRLAEMLSEGNLNDLKESFIRSLEGGDSVQDVLENVENELTFHQTILAISACKRSEGEHRSPDFNH